MPEFFDKIKDFFDGDDDDDDRAQRRDGDDADGCVPDRWLGTFERDGELFDVEVTDDDDAWMLVLFASVLGNDDAILRKAEEWRELARHAGH